MKKATIKPKYEDNKHFNIFILATSHQAKIKNSPHITSSFRPFANKYN